MLDFAVNLGLIDSDESLAILRDFETEHPDLDQWLTDEGKRLSSGR